MKVSIKEIQPHPLNKEIYSLSNLDDLIKSIEEVGLLQPIIINHKKQILSGHRRFECIKKLGWIEVEVVVKKVDEKETDFYLVQFNKQRIKTTKELLGEYDVIEKHYENKRGKIKNVRTNNHIEKNYNRIDITAKELGIKSSQLGKLLFIRKHREDYIDLIDREIITTHQAYTKTNREIKKKESISYKTKTKSIKNEKWRVNYKSSDNLSELDNEEVQTIFPSPPYWNKRTYLEGGGLGNEP